MSLSDCEKCWETPCVCGHEYEGYSLKRLHEMRKMFDKIIYEKEMAIANEKDDYGFTYTKDEWRKIKGTKPMEGRVF